SSLLRYLSHRFLHSFPTRRSSDLVTVASTVWNSCSIGLCFVKQTRPFQASLVCNFCSSVRDFASSFLQIPPRDGHPCLWLTVPTDRKSTRLNSSHVSISYAVFCLK